MYNREVFRIWGKLMIKFFFRYMWNLIFSDVSGFCNAKIFFFHDWYIIYETKSNWIFTVLLLKSRVYWLHKSQVWWKQLKVEKLKLKKLISCLEGREQAREVLFEDNSREAIKVNKNVIIIILKVLNSPLLMWLFTS